MKDLEIEMVQTSWAKVAAIAPQVATMFSDRLFTTNLELKPLFANADLAQQKMRLISALSGTISNLREPAKLRDVLFELGKRHRSFGVQERDYDAVGAALIWTLERGLGEAWTADVGNAWLAVYGFVAAEMQRGARSDESCAA